MGRVIAHLRAATAAKQLLLQPVHCFGDKCEAGIKGGTADRAVACRHLLLLVPLLPRVVHRPPCMEEGLQHLATAHAHRLHHGRLTAAAARCSQHRPAGG
jgi:hypothetical protein